MSEEVTLLLSKWKEGDGEALNQLIPLVYKELYRIAQKRLSLERSDHTLQATALVNEAYLRLVKINAINWQNRAHFFAISAQLMRNILVDYARKQLANKRLAPKDTSLTILSEETSNKPVDLIDLDNALIKLSAIDEQQSKIIELRFFGGLTLEEIAEVMNFSTKTAWKELEIAKLWLSKELVI